MITALLIISITFFFIFLAVVAITSDSRSESDEGVPIMAFIAFVAMIPIIALSISINNDHARKVKQIKKDTKFICQLQHGSLHNNVCVVGGRVVPTTLKDSK